MAKENNQPETLPTPVTAEPVLFSCRKMEKAEDAGFMKNMSSRFGKFFQAPMVEHKQCFVNAVQTMTNKMKIGGEKKSESKEAAENSQALQPTAAAK